MFYIVVRQLCLDFLTIFSLGNTANIYGVPKILKIYR